MAFSSLQDRAGVEDGGRFNYHLGKLVPEFVREDDAEYALTHAGEQLIGDAVSGMYRRNKATAPGSYGNLRFP
ncbi:MAG: hypothetical protein J07HX64_01860 [halophilic archaeon J07HX64]|nr:MAG: hypothetical protein J07HX64_01860 [halophilic archaeon J07HX64]